MGRQEVEQALRAMDEEDVRRRLREGDFAVLENVDLTPEERTLVRDAAGDYPEVAGFMFDAFINFGDIKGDPTDDKHKDWVEALARKDKWVLASNYARGI